MVVGRLASTARHLGTGVIGTILRIAAVAVRCTACLYTFAAGFSAGLPVNVKRVSARTRCCGRAVSRRACRGHASMVADCITVGRVAWHSCAYVIETILRIAAIAVGRAVS